MSKWDKAGRLEVGVRLEDLSHDELRALKEVVDRRDGVTQRSLGDLNLEHELMSQFDKVKDLQESVLNDEGCPANQKAQVAGQVASTLQQLIKMQTEFYTAERFRSIENLMIKYMKKLPLEAAKGFIDEYEKLGDANV